jgi:hypothetical protein
MDLTIHASFLPHTDPDAALAFYRDTRGFQVRNDVGYGGMCWITVGPPDQPHEANSKEEANAEVEANAEEMTTTRASQTQSSQRGRMQ